MGTWTLGPRNTRAWHRFSRGQVGWVLKRYGFVVTQGDPQKVALLKGFITTIHWTLGVRYPSWKPTQLVVALAGRALVCASKIFLVCASNIFLVCASLFAFYHIFHRAAASLVPPLLARLCPHFWLVSMVFHCLLCGFHGFHGFHCFYAFHAVSVVSIMRLRFPLFPWFPWFPWFSMVPIGFVRFPWFPWFPWFPCFPWFPWFLSGAHGFYNASPVSMVSMVSMVSTGFVRFPWFPWFLCGFHGFYNASPVSMVSMDSIHVFCGFGGFYGFHWLCAVSMVSMVFMVSMRCPWFLWCVAGFHAFHGLCSFDAVWVVCGFHVFHSLSPVSMVSMVCLLSLRFLWFLWYFHVFSIIFADSMVFIYVCEFYACYFSWYIVVVLDPQWYSSFEWYMHFPGILWLLFERMQLTPMSATKKTCSILNLISKLRMYWR